LSEANKHGNLLTRNYSEKQLGTSSLLPVFKRTQSS